MTKMNLPSFSDSVSKGFEKTLVRLSIVAALTVGVGFGSSYFIFQVRSDKNFIKGIQAHVSSLVETTNRPDLQRLLTSIHDQKNSDLIVVQNGITVASSRAMSPRCECPTSTTGSRVFRKGRSTWP